MVLRLITVHQYHDVSFSPKTSKPGNEDLFATIGEESGGGGGGGGGFRKLPTVTVTLFQTLVAVDTLRMMENPTKSCFRASVTSSLLQPQRKFHADNLSQRFRAPSKSTQRWTNND